MTEEHRHRSPDQENDTSYHTVLHHLHARIIELEANVAWLQQQDSRAKSRSHVLLSIYHTLMHAVQTILAWRPRAIIRKVNKVNHKRRQQAQVTLNKELRQAEPQGSVLLVQQETELAELHLMVWMTIITFASVAFGWLSESLLPFAWVAWVFYALAYLNGSFYALQEAWLSFKQRQFDINVLMILAAFGTVLIGQPREGAILMFLFALSQMLETYAMGRTHANLRSLMDMTPKCARVVRSLSNREYEEDIPVEQVQIGDIVRVRPGEQIPVDGIVIRGFSAVDEAAITGESMPIEKQPQARVFAGTINGQGTLDMTTTTVPSDSTLARIVKIVRQAREQKALSQDFTDRIIGQYYAYAVVVMTILSMIIPPLFLGWDIRTTFYRAITLMVGASPCALVISIPAAILSALASSSWHGVLFKGGKYLERASHIRVVAFDKTGTLTMGKPGVTAIISLSQEIPQYGVRISQEQPISEGKDPLSDDHMRLLTIAAAVERFSEHPLAKAIVAEAKQQRLVLPEVHHFEAKAGFGVRATLGEHEIHIGRPSIFEQLHHQVITSDIASVIAYQEQQGQTVILVGTTSRIWGIIALADTVRSESATIVPLLKQVGIDRVVLLTGDNRDVARHLGEKLGIDEIHAGLTPEQKVEAIRHIQSTYGPVAMIGDGINDAPALASATLGIAMGAAGTDVAMESADVVLMSNNLRLIPYMLILARRTRRIVRQNFVIAFGVMLMLVFLTLSGMLPLTLAMIGHEGSTLLVVANGLRLLAPMKNFETRGFHEERT